MITKIYACRHCGKIEEYTTAYPPEYCDDCIAYFKDPSKAEERHREWIKTVAETRETYQRTGKYFICGKPVDGLTAKSYLCKKLNMSYADWQRLDTLSRLTPVATDVCN